MGSRAPIYPCGGIGYSTAMDEPRKPRLRWFQYSLRTLFLAVFLVSIGMSWVAVRIERARREREAVAAIVKLGGQVEYDYQVQQPGGPLPGADPPGPAWLRNLLGENFFATVVHVYLADSTALDPGLGHLKELTQLGTLNLMRTNVADASLEHLKGLTQLKALCLDSTKVTDAGIEHLKGLTQLQELDLGDTKVTDAGLEHLKGLTQLQTLDLDATKVTDAGLEYLEGLTQLQTLGLRRTRVSDAGLERLKGLAKLETLYVFDTAVTYKGVRKMQQALPKCKVQTLYW